jgi:hypothetical protein
MKKVAEVYRDTIIHCKTEREAIAICQLMHDAGLQWKDGKSYIEENKWHFYEKSTCYRPHRGESYHINWLRKVGASIDPASDYLPAKFYNEKPNSMKYLVTYHFRGELLWKFESKRMVEAAWLFVEQSKKVGAETTEDEHGILVCQTETKKLILKSI